MSLVDDVQRRCLCSHCEVAVNGQRTTTMTLDGDTMVLGIRMGYTKRHTAPGRAALTLLDAEAEAERCQKPLFAAAVESLLHVGPFEELLTANVSTAGAEVVKVQPAQCDNADAVQLGAERAFTESRPVATLDASAGGTQVALIVAVTSHRSRPRGRGSSSTCPTWPRSR